jgi:hypothetical protein
LSELERLPLYDPQAPFADVRENPGAYPEIHEWLPATLDISLLDRQDGAGQVRRLGRMAFYKSFGFFERRVDYVFTQCQRIRTQLEAMKRYEFDVAADSVVYVVSSVCGGQGAGMVVDLAVALRTMAAGRFPSLNLIGALAMPSVFADRIPRENRSKTFANAHAAMKEIDCLRGLRSDRHATLPGNRHAVRRPQRERAHQPELGRRPRTRQSPSYGPPLQQLRQPHDLFRPRKDRRVGEPEIRLRHRARNIARRIVLDGRA